MKAYKMTKTELPMLDGPVDAYKIYKKTKSGRKATKRPVRGSSTAAKRGK